MSSQSVSRRYAIALADVLSEVAQPRNIQEELISWEQMISSNLQLREVFANPTIPYEQKRAVLNELIGKTGVQETTANFLQILLKNQRLTALAGVNSKLADVLDERAGAVAAHITTAHPVSEESKRSISEKLSRFTGKSVRLSFALDDSLIGGIVSRVGSTVYDGSIRTQLDQMEKALAGEV